jgi:hypothetical protein
MKVTIIKDDGVVLVDGRAIHVDLSDMPANIHAVQFNGTKGHVEYTDALNKGITSITAFQTWLDRWEAVRAVEDAPPPALTAEQIAALQESKIKADIVSKEMASLQNGFVRTVREFMIQFALDKAIYNGKSEAQLLDDKSPDYDPGFAKLKGWDSEVSTIRAQLAEIVKPSNPEPLE